jgi:site-specific DNA-methyltransferase (adenine-specific)
MIPLHPITAIFPTMTDKAYAELRDSIRAHGLREAVWTYQGTLIDGRHRQQACEETGVPLRTREWDGNGSLTEFVLDLNMRRRDLAADQRAMAAANAIPFLAAEAKERQREAARASAATKPRASGRFTSKPTETDKTTLRPNDRKLAKPETTKPRAPMARDHAGKAHGVSGRQVERAAQIKREAPELAEQVASGKLKLSQATRQVINAQKTKALEEKAKAVELKDGQPSWTLICADVLDGLQSVIDHHGPARLVFADPPYNQGVDYGKGAKADRLHDEDYLAWCQKWIALCRDCLTPDGSFFLMIGDEYADHFGLLLRKAGFHRRNWIKWYETFGVNCPNSFNRTSRHIFYCVRDPKRFTFNASAVNRPSDRQTKHADKRAAAGGKNWNDVWDIPRLVGTAKERIPEFPTQLPIELLRPIVGCASDPGDLIVDPFNGSGTTGAAAIELSRKYIGIDSSAKFIELADLRLRGVKPRGKL